MCDGHRLADIWISAVLAGMVVSSWCGFSGVPLSVVVVRISCGSRDWEPQRCSLDASRFLGGGGSFCSGCSPGCGGFGGGSCWGCGCGGLSCGCCGCSW